MPFFLAPSIFLYPQGDRGWAFICVRRTTSYQKAALVIDWTNMGESLRIVLPFIFGWYNVAQQSSRFESYAAASLGVVAALSVSVG
jgi:hypothetical protein